MLRQQTFTKRRRAIRGSLKIVSPEVPSEAKPEAAARRNYSINPPTKIIEMGHYNVLRCPCCGGTAITVKAALWMDFVAGHAVNFDDFELAEADPIIGTEAYCRTCKQAWVVRKVTAGDPGLYWCVGFDQVVVRRDEIEKLKKAAAERDAARSARTAALRAKYPSRDE